MAKDGVAIILSRLAKKKAGASDDAEEGDEYGAAAQEVLAAVKEGDAEGLATALKAFVAMCGTEE